MLIAGQAYRLALRQSHGVAVIFVDLDGLKTINDKLGHEHGDAAIRALGDILKTMFRESDVIARLGGDEFAVLAYNVDRDRLQIVLDRVHTIVAAAPPIGPYPLAASIGHAILAPGDKTSLEDLLAQADQRMYEAKRARKAAAAAS